MTNSAETVVCPPNKILDQDKEKFTNAPSPSTYHNRSIPPVYNGVVKSITTQLINWMIDEITNQDEMNSKLKSNLVLPILRIVQDQITPYAIFVLIFAIMLLIISVANLTFNIIYYFRR